ncbi:polyprenyl synthetase family protein [Actinokineospora enzanensis]|uniref:polyprenyl synthetase family protein n=1 Tax=Actinokineospora enzanensis TaxID=155975 RepID=UPI000368C93C|nr:polyprenyl synthetase family protein [Actinokineospora enzanensis]
MSVVGVVQDGDVAVVDEVLDEFLTEREMWLAELAAPVRLLRGFLGSSRKVAATFCAAGWRVGGGVGALPGEVARAAAALEMFHVGARVRDEAAAGIPAARRVLLIEGARRTDAMVVLGDLAFAWAADLAPGVLSTMRSEALVGQYLESVADNASADVPRALKVCAYRSAKCTVEHPLRVGAEYAHADNETLRACSAYGVPLGEAYRLRDDLLAVFGDPGHDLVDLRIGRPTVLLAAARRLADADQHKLLDDLVGDPQLDAPDAARLRAVLVETGARRTVELMISHRCRAAKAALAGFHSADTTMLRQLLNLATHRE